MTGSFFSRLRRAEIGTHHHVAGPYLHQYANEMAWAKIIAGSVMANSIGRSPRRRLVIPFRASGKAIGSGMHPTPSALFEAASASHAKDDA
jgi:hypothetical protein